MDLAEIRRLSAGYQERFGSGFASEKVPTLSEVLDLLKGRAQVMIEVKKESIGTSERDGVEARTLTEVERAGMSDDVAMVSFDRRALLRARALAPGIPRGHLFRGVGIEEVLAGARAVACDVVMPHKSMLSEELKARVGDAGLRLATWVIDDPGELRTLARSFDLYGVGSNCPGLLLKAS